ncbi:MAG: tetratricopeptide repeat protein [Acidobacteria bacterium]|nr:tetratricopeptide repeat protein [Acidobacteriota bacterium]
MTSIVAAAVLLLIAPATSNQQPAFAQGASAGKPAQEATSLLGRPLVPAAPSAEAKARMEAQLAEADAALKAAPDSADALIWVGRRQAYLGRYGDAIATFTRGIERFPSDARFYRHRGHRYLTTRQLAEAVTDFEKAVALTRGQPDQVEPDGQPNARNIPTSTLQTNIWYHLGLAHYLRGDFAAASRAYAEDLKISPNDDNLVAVTHWAYMTARRLGRDDEAKKLLEPITKSLHVIENGSYHRLLLMYKGEVPEAEILKAVDAGLDLVTIGYGVGNWHFYNGRRDKAFEVWNKILAQKDQWPAFGYLAAEADVSRGSSGFAIW